MGDTKHKEYNQMVTELETTRQLLGINGDCLILEFLGKMNSFTPLSMRICSRIIQFEQMISTLSELLIREIDDDEESNLNKIAWLFVQPQIGLEEFVKPLKDAGIETVIDFKAACKGKLS